MQFSGQIDHIATTHAAIIGGTTGATTLALSAVDPTLIDHSLQIFAWVSGGLASTLSILLMCFKIWRDGK